ncbi:DUF397 domain-containing protein [Spirillospora sp. NPDC048911]|uniref:DUF397 domain-containing protein n=1 Tax=Spirillospora sp. NPDC048911 TaxID=3364527 RepID=UPI0037218A4F
MRDLTKARWRKSTHSDQHGGDCVELAAVWCKASRGDQSSVEVARMAPMVAVRDSKNPSGPILIFGAATWRTFVHRVSTDGSDLAWPP